MKFHLIGNSHLDPVWLWDWREGLNEGIITCRAILQLMEEYPQLNYIRGETSIYRHIEEHDPHSFERIKGHIESGRWDVVGGTVCQPDTNLPATEVLCRHFTEGLRYLQRTFGVRPTVAWAADSFGHSGGWPEIYAAAGMNSFACSRPFETDCPLPAPAFWWEAPSGRRVLTWRIPLAWYGTDRSEVTKRLDEFLSKSAEWGVGNVAVTFGLGNHGGGPSRREIEEIISWREANRDVDLEFSTFHRFFAALHRESEQREFPVAKRELNFTLRGCYSSAARFKFNYRKTENTLVRAERISTAMAASIGERFPDLSREWDAVLFNTFHDVLPGTSIERAFEDQLAWLGLAVHGAQRAELAALNALALRLDTRVPAPADSNMPAAVPVLLWNPHPRPFRGLAEIEACLDYRQIHAYVNRGDDLPVSVRDVRGRRMPFQQVQIDNHFGTQLPWRRRFVIPINIPAMGWSLVRVAWEEGAVPPPAPKDAVTSKGNTSISNGSLTVSARPGRLGIDLLLDGKRLFGAKGLQVGTFQDPYGSWGNHDGELAGDDISELLATWKVERTKVLERGPHRAALWVQLGAGASRLDLTFFLERGARIVRVASRLVWNERSVRLKLIFPGDASRVDYEVPGGVVTRSPLGEVPGGRWTRIRGSGTSWVFASDALYNFDQSKHAFRATVVRSTRYAWNSSSGPDDEPWRPHLDLGEHRFQFALGPDGTDPWELADGLEQPVQGMPTAPHEGQKKPKGSLLRLSRGLRLLALKPALAGNNAVILRVHNTRQRAAVASVSWLGQAINLGRVPAGQIASWRLNPPSGSKNTWSAIPVNTPEEQV